MASDDSDPVVVLMDAARWALDESHHAERVAEGARTAEGKAIADARRGAYDAAAAELRHIARWLDGDSPDKPASLVVGEAHRKGDGVPWRDGDGE